MDGRRRVDHRSTHHIPGLSDEWSERKREKKKKMGNSGFCEGKFSFTASHGYFEIFVRGLLLGYCPNYYFRDIYLINKQCGFVLSYTIRLV